MICTNTCTWSVAYLSRVAFSLCLAAAVSVPKKQVRIPQNNSSRAAQRDDATFSKVATKWQEQRKSAIMQQLSFGGHTEASRAPSGIQQPLLHAMHTLNRWLRGFADLAGYARQSGLSASVVPIISTPVATARQAPEAAEPERRQQNLDVDMEAPPGQEDMAVRVGLLTLTRMQRNRMNFAANSIGNTSIDLCIQCIMCAGRYWWSVDLYLHRDGYAC